MYTKERLRKYPYFEEIFRLQDTGTVIDSLTGLISRRHIIGFIQHLMEKGVPFTLALLDLDNFKFINDTYGHKTGDGVLAGLSADLERYLGDYGVAGRYGGDEFLIVNFRDHCYEDIKEFFIGLYSNFNVLRKNIALGDCEPFVTGTIGCAVFPKDAQDYVSLFGLIDKALYRGKTKGRNCYIIYVEEKHKHISIQKLAGRGIYRILHDLAARFDAPLAVPDKLQAMLEILKEDMRISDLYYVGQDHQFKSVSTGKALGRVQGLEELMEADVYTTNEIKKMAAKSASLFELCREQEFETVLLTRIGIQQETFGYLVCAEAKNLRIWQEDEHAILFFAARMLAAHLQASGGKL